EAEITDLWGKAAQAAHDIIEWNRYTLEDDYGKLFVGNTSSSPEIILSRRSTSSNGLEKKNYPIGTPGGNSGVTPSDNLVKAYEYIGAQDPDNPYANRDMRFYSTIVYNGARWNGRTIDISKDGTDSYMASGASRTGYYLKKYLTDELNIANDQKAAHQWIIFRYAEILMNYAEAANEAWGPDDGGHVTTGLTARAALNRIRSRAGLGEVDLTKYAGASDKEKMRNAIKAERRVEFAFEGHRYWDLMRWKDGSVLKEPIAGVRYDGTSYQTIVVEKRVFEDHMHRYPIPFTEISKSNGIIEQNIGW
ncbi:MAG: RagB/SusD family nutrient uptake outer membrane protein, partial [Bacteroidales bacterium]|nr:RagB/SusD family nutrient uptake outer membrane protein [Bacteroidales bacterium]